MIEWICYRCFTVQTVSQMRRAIHVKGLSVEDAKRLDIKMCKNCKCRTFWRL